MANSSSDSQIRIREIDVSLSRSRVYFDGIAISDGTKFTNCGMRMKSGLRIVSAGRRSIWSAFLFDAVPLIRRWTRERSYKGDATSRRQTSSRRYRNARKFLFGWFRLDIGELGRDDSEPNSHIASPIAYKMYQIFQPPYSHPFCLYVVRCAISHWVALLVHPRS